MKQIPYQKALEVRQETDVLVAGGGAAGVAAAIAAARMGARVLLIEASGSLGGLGTTGMVPAFAAFTDGVHPLCSGIGMEIRRQVSVHTPLEARWTPVDAEELKRVYDRMVSEAGVQTLFFTNLADMICEGDRAQYAVLTSREGLYAVRAKVFIDCTGDGCLAAAAGADFAVGDAQEQVMPPTLCSLWGGLNAEAYSKAPVRERLEQAIADGVFTFADRHLSGLYLREDGAAGGNVGHIFGTDCLDEASMTQAMMWGRTSMQEYEYFYRHYVEGCQDLHLLATAPMLGVRESRRLRCDYTLQAADFLSRADFEDEIGRCSYPVDIHIMNTENEEMKRFEDEYRALSYAPGESYGIPYRSLVVAGLENVLTAGRCMGTDRQMQASVRVIPGCYVTGQAAGTAAALALKADGRVRGVSARQLQQALADSGAYIRPALLQDGIALAGESDIEAIGKIMQEAVRNLQHRDWFLDSDSDFIRRNIAEDGYTLIYWAGGVPAGYLMVYYPGQSEENLGTFLHLPPEQMDRVVHMESAGVIPECRGQGIFQKLLQRALQMEREKGQACYAMGTVHPDNCFSLNQFCKAGFQKAATVPLYGSWVRCVMWRKL